MDKPNLIKGELFTDVRGHLLCWNQYNPTERGIKRSYVVENRDKGYIRAFHAHQYEEKYIRIVKGAAKFVFYKPIDIETGDVGLYNRESVQEIVLDYREPKILHIEGGWAHGYKTLEENTVVLVDSNKTLEESKKDDFRYDWKIIGEYIWQEKYY